MELSFTKMHGAGNDYIYLNCLHKEREDFSRLAQYLSPRRTSVGADGLVAICSSRLADAKMRMFNPDGSESPMCGNAIRCVGKYLYDHGIVRKPSLSIETLSGIRHLQLHVEDGQVQSVTVDMGCAVLDPAQIPLASETPFLAEPYEIGGTLYRLTCVSMGNPHAILFDSDPAARDLEVLGPQIETDRLFPLRTNVEFVRVVDETTLQMRVWERGCGETHACGTGACAAAVAAVLNGYCLYDRPIAVWLPGGVLQATVDRQLRVLLTGDAVTVYTGTCNLEE